MRIRLVIPLVALLALLAPRATRAQERMPPFGRAGQVVLDDLAGGRFGAPGYLGQLGGHGALGDQTELKPGLGIAPPSAGFAGLAGYERHSVDAGYGDAAKITQETFWIAPAVDVFVARRVSIGVAAGLLLENASAEGDRFMPGAKVHSVVLSIVPRVGYVFPITERLALWPRLGAGYSRGAMYGEDDLSGESSYAAVNETWLGGVDLGIVGRVTEWLYLHVSPTLDASYSRSGNAAGDYEDFTIGFGGTATVGLSL